MYSFSSYLPPSALTWTNEPWMRGMVIALLLLVPFQEKQSCGGPEELRNSQTRCRRGLLGWWTLLFFCSKQMHLKSLPSEHSIWQLQSVTEPEYFYLLKRKMLWEEGIDVMVSDKIFHLGLPSCHLPVSEKTHVSQNIFFLFNCWEVIKWVRNVKLRFVDKCH